MNKKDYLKMSKEEKRFAREKYYKTESGKINKGRFSRLLLCGILSIIYALFLIVDGIIKKSSFWVYIFAAFIIVFGIVFLVGRHKILIRNMNSFLKKNK